MKSGIGNSHRAVLGICAGLLLAVSATITSFSATAQTYPARNINVLVGFAAGGNTDLFARLLTPKMSELLKVSVIVENKPGANQIAAIQSMTSNAPDGYTLFLGTGSSLGQNPGVQKDLPYNPIRDFSLIALCGTTPGVVVVRSDLPIRTIKELVDYAKKSTSKLNYGSAGIGSANQLMMEYFMATTGTSMVHVPFKSDAQNVTELVAGRIDVSFAGITAAEPQMKSGKLTILSSTSVKPLPFAPTLPTLGDAGIKGLEGLDPFTFYGFVAPAGMDGAVLRKLNDTINQVMRMPDVASRSRDTLRVEPVTESPEYFRQFLTSQIAKWTEVGKNIKIEKF